MPTPQAISNEDHGIHLVTRWFEEVWNQGKRETIRELFAKDSVLHDGSTDIKGAEEFESFYDRLRERFSDFSIKPEVSFAQGDMVCMRWKAVFKEKASGKPVQITGMSMVCQKNGKFVEAWQNWDAAGVEAQLNARAVSA